MKANVEILGVPITRNTFSDIEKWTTEAVSGDKQLVVAKAPSEFLLRAKRNPEFLKVLLSADLLIADGIGVLWAAKFLSLPFATKKLLIANYKLLVTIEAIWQMLYTGFLLVFKRGYARDVLPERLSGVEALYTMLTGCEKAGRSVYIFGARPEVLVKSIQEIGLRFPSLKIAGSHDGYSDKGQEVIDDINKSDASLLVVALGSPEQEYWIRDNIAKLPSVRVAVGEGGSFDAISGTTKRAPKFLQNIGLEWLWRGIFAKNLTGSGHRIKRIWNAVPVFIVEVVKWKIKNGPNEAE